ncbi:zinc finger protein 250-like [Drosophila hydei]|uniref:Zinc finger protein 250-like n=1 Tax=Drosophila hydei TaxID=7224 RepID=A0A6J1L6R3_DROHY|nr:zinc finger protein 250-like [Drosophila hydei]
MKNVENFKSSNACDICGKCFSKPALLRRHLVVHSAEKAFPCESCCSRFSQKSSLQRHIRIKHDVAKKCDESDVAQHALAALKLLQGSPTIKDNAIVNHNLAAAASFATQGTLEEKTSCDVVELRDNLNPAGEVRVIITQRILRQNTNRCYYVCEYCAKEFSKSYDLIRHRRSHTKETPYLCGICFKRFAIQSKLNEHHKRLHAAVKKHACTECIASFRSKTELHKHLGEEHPNTVYSCEHCSRTFKTKSACDAHTKLETHSLKTKLMELLPQPVLSHRSFKCIYCEKNFKRKYNCRTHMLLHLRRLIDTKQMKHSCLQCGKHFKRPNDLARHLLTHSKLKLHICHVCRRRFTLKSTLARHLETHQPQRSSVNCQVCGKSYASKTSLQLHLRLHTGERPFKCEICGESFRTSGHRLEHMRAERHKSASSNALIL